jgi:hypothetical protein
MTTIDRDADDDVGLERAEDFARQHPGLVKLGRVGWVAKGVVYVLTGILAMLIAVGSTSGSGSTGATGGSGQEASPGGAISRIAETSGGTFLLCVIAAGLVLYSAWRVVTALLPADTEAASWLTRAGYLISAATYLVLAWTALSFVRNPGDPQQSEDSRIESFTADVLSRSFGRVLVFAVGAVVLIVAATFLWKAVTASFTSQLGAGGIGPISHRTLVAMGRVGWVGRAAMMGLIGFFLCRAAVRFDADDAQGLDGSLRKAASSGLGTGLVLVVAVGLLVYGVFCVLSAPRRLLVAADR